MLAFDVVVGVPLRAMPHGREQLVEHDRVGSACSSPITAAATAPRKVPVDVTLTSRRTGWPPARWSGSGTAILPPSSSSNPPLDVLPPETRRKPRACSGSLAEAAQGGDEHAQQDQ